MKRSVMAVAVVLAMVMMGFAGSAMADIITGYSGYGASGTGLYGLSWSWNNTSPTASVWGEPGLGDGELTWTGPTVTDFAFILGTAFGVPAGTVILTTPAGEPVGGYTTDTRFSNTTAGVLWTAVTPVGTNFDEIEFFAPAGGALVAGDSFFVNIALNTYLPNLAEVGFVAQYSQPVPLPPALAVFAPGLLGLIGLRRRFL